MSDGFTLWFTGLSGAGKTTIAEIVGPEVNLGNIPPDEVIPLETLRLGLRSDTIEEVLLSEQRARIS